MPWNLQSVVLIADGELGDKDPNGGLSKLWSLFGSLL